MPSITFKIQSYNAKSAGARYLRQALRKHLGYEPEMVPPDYVIPSNTWVINWGNGSYPGERAERAKNTKVINPMNTILPCINKVDFFRVMENCDVNLPDWTQRRSVAERWCSQGDTLYCRETAEGRDGQGIVIATRPSQLIAARLYTIAVPSTEEFRVHVFRNKPIFDLLKWHENPTKQAQQVRTGSQGWEYTRDCRVPASGHKQAVAVAKALGVDFCAVDLLYNAKTDVSTVLEANSAPELGPWTSAAYARELVALKEVA